MQKQLIVSLFGFSSVSAAENTDVAESGVPALSTSVESAAAGDDHLSQSAADASATAMQSDVVVDVPSDDTARSAEYTDLNEESEVERRLSEEMPGTPESLPSLVSEPEDTCTPVKFLKVSTAACTYNELTPLANVLPGKP